MPKKVLVTGAGGTIGTILRETLADRYDFTLVDWKGKPAPDGRRYKAVGNSMAVPVMKWIGRRILMVEEILAELGDR